MTKSLAHFSVENVKDTHIEVNKYWLLQCGNVGVDTITERLPTSQDFLPDEVNNSLTHVCSRVVGLSECPDSVRTVFTAVLARRVRRSSKPGPLKPKQLPDPSRKPTSGRLAQIMQFR